MHACGGNIPAEGIHRGCVSNISPNVYLRRAYTVSIINSDPNAYMGDIHRGGAVSIM